MEASIFFIVHLLIKLPQCHFMYTKHKLSISLSDLKKERSQKRFMAGLIFNIL